MKKIIASVTITVSILSLVTCAAFAGDLDQHSKNAAGVAYLASDSSSWKNASAQMLCSKDNDNDDNGKGNVKDKDKNQGKDNDKDNGKGDDKDNGKGHDKDHDHGGGHEVSDY